MPETSATITTLPLQGAKATLEDNVDLRSLIPGAARVLTPIVYSAQMWDLKGFPLVNQTVQSFDFSGVPARWQPLVKDWVLLRLNPELAHSGMSGLDTSDVMASAAAAERPITVPSALAYIGCLAISLTIIESNGWRQMGPEDWRSFALQLAAENPNLAPQTLAGYARPLLWIWSYRGLLREPEILGGRPFNGKTVEHVFNVPASDLNVVRPAPELVGPLLGLSLWILDNCAEDILSRLEKLASAPDITAHPRGDQLEAVRMRLTEWERTGRPLPGVKSLRTGKPAPAWATFVKLAGCSNEALRNPMGEAGKTFLRLRHELGVSAMEDGFNLPLTKVSTGDGNSTEWIDAMPPTKFHFGLNHWADTLAICCTYIIAVLTTVRERELAALPHDCLTPGTFEKGDLDVAITRMRGYLVKNRAKPLPTSWVVGEDVIRAVETIHRLKKALRLAPTYHPTTGKEVLLHPYLCGSTGREKTKNSLMLSGSYLGRLQTSGAFLARRGLIPELPELPRWLAHRTIRITGVEAYASQPWGDALAAAQAKWSNRTVAEGYFGHLPKSVFVADPSSVEEARLLSVGQALLDVAHDELLGIQAVAGNGAGRLDQALAKGKAYELVTGPVTGRQIVQLAKSNPNIFVGELTTCVHGQGGLCGNAEEADFKLCHPFACRHSAVTPAQRARRELRRRGFVLYEGVFKRAAKKIDLDDPNLAHDFQQSSDEELRELILRDLPGRFLRSAQEASTND